MQLMRKSVVLVAMAATAVLAPSTASADEYGACVIRDGFTNQPSYWDDAFAPGYAKMNVSIRDHLALLATCTQEVYAELMSLHCSCNPDPQPVQWTVTSFNSQGFFAFIGPDDTAFLGCSAFGCEIHSCANVSTIACPHPTPISGLKEVVNGIPGLAADIADSLLTKLTNAEASLASGNRAAACGQLGAFENQVSAQSGKKIPTVFVAVLLNKVAADQTAIGCP